MFQGGVLKHREGEACSVIRRRTRSRLPSAPLRIDPNPSPTPRMPAWPHADSRSWRTFRLSRTFTPCTRRSKKKRRTRRCKRLGGVCTCLHAQMRARARVHVCGHMLARTRTCMHDARQNGTQASRALLALSIPAPSPPQRRVFACMRAHRVDTSAFPTEGCTVRGRSALVRFIVSSAMLVFMRAHARARELCERAPEPCNIARLCVCVSPSVSPSGLSTSIPKR